jgi:cytochrome P450
MTVAHNEENGNVDSAFFRHHFSLWEPTFLEQKDRGIRYLVDQCPMTWSDQFGGFWVVSSYEGVVQGYQDWRRFSSAPERSLPSLRDSQPLRRPIDLDPPLQRRYRQLLNPYLTPSRLAPFEPWIRNLVTGLIDDFIADGHCDLAARFARAIPGRMLFRLLLGIDDDDVPMVQAWLSNVIFNPTGPDTPAEERKCTDWIQSVVQTRRRGPRQDDIIDALLHADIDGERLTDDEVMATMYVLIQGGFGTTADAIGNSALRLAEDRDLQHRLRQAPELIPAAIEEFLRVDSPVSAQARICVHDTTFEGEDVKEGERLFMFLSAANRDPSEFSEPDELDVDREPNRHLAFGVGPHRCIGSNVARLNLRIALEELLSRTSDFWITPGAEVVRKGSIAWGPAFLPLTFVASNQAGDEMPEA